IGPVAGVMPKPARLSAEADSQMSRATNESPTLCRSASTVPSSAAGATSVLPARRGERVAQLRDRDCQQGVDHHEVEVDRDAGTEVSVRMEEDREAAVGETDQVVRSGVGQVRVRERRPHLAGRAVPQGRMLRSDLAAARECQASRGVPDDDVDQSVADGGGGRVEGGLEGSEIDIGAALYLLVPVAPAPVAAAQAGETASVASAYL